MTDKTTHEIVSDILAHHGVKGMKWGVVRETTAATTLSKSERREARKNVSALSSKSIETKYAKDFIERKITPEQYAKLSNKDVVVKKGQTIARITQNKNESVGDAKYVSYKKKDKNLYRAIMPVVSSPLKFGGNKRYKATYEMTYKSLATLKSPSEKARVDAFSELFDTPSIRLKNGKTVTGRDFLKRSYPREVRTLTSQQLGLRFYNNFTETQYSKSPLNTAYFDKLRSKGYNAVVDDNDRVHLSDSPLILLNPSGTLKKINIEPLTADDINNAQRALDVKQGDAK